MQANMRWSVQNSNESDPQRPGLSSDGKFDVLEPASAWAGEMYIDYFQYCGYTLQVNFTQDPDQGLPLWQAEEPPHRLTRGRVHG